MSELETLLQKGDVATAKRVADQRLASNPSDGEALLARARLHMNDRQTEEAATLIKRAQELGVAEAIVWKAILGEMIGYPKAQEVLEQACTTATRYEPFFVLGKLLNSKKEFAKARPYLEQALQLNPDQPVAHFQLAYSLIELGEVKAAVEHLKRCLKIAPYPPAFVVMSRLLESNGHPADAKELIQKGLKLMPEEGPLLKEWQRLSQGA